MRMKSRRAIQALDKRQRLSRQVTPTGVPVLRNIADVFFLVIELCIEMLRESPQPIKRGLIQLFADVRIYLSTTTH